MRKPKKSKGRSPKKSVSWVEHIDKDTPRLVVPVGPRFQATVPEFTNGGNSLDDSRWLGTRMWPISEVRSSVGTCNKIGKGRPDSCACADSGLVKCVNRHVAEERKKLINELGPAFKEWKFDTMGEVVSKSWTAEQQKKFDALVRMNPVSENRTFLKPAVKSFSSKTEEEIVNYYLNVYIPRHMGQQIRSGSLVIDTDDETEITTHEDSLKRSRPPKDDSSKNVKPRYLVGRR